MKKICFLITTRGNHGKTKTIIENLKGKAEIQYIAGGTCPEMKFYGKAKRVDIFEPIEYCAGILSINAGIILNELEPDVLVITGDRFECLPFAMIAFYMGIQIAHIEGGELSGNIDEGIRHAISKMASVHFPSNKDAMDRLVRMGENPAKIFPVGATSFDVLKEYAVEKEVYPYLVSIVHPSKGINLDIIESAVNYFDMEVVWIKPNIDIGSADIQKDNNRISFSIEGFASLLKNCVCLVGNSSSGIREAPFLGVPSVNIGKRQNNRYAPQSVMSVDCDYEQIRTVIQEQIEHGHYEPNYTYGDGNSGIRIADILINNNFEVQKVFYENIGHCPGSRWESGHQKQEHHMVRQETAL